MEKSDKLIKWKEEEYLDRIADANLFSIHLKTDCSLSQGKMGIAIFYYLYSRHKRSIIYEKFADKILNSIYDNINNSMPINLFYGLTGIGWGIIFLISQKILNGDLDDILYEIDIKLMEYNLNCMNDSSIDTGKEGILWYILLRLLTSTQSKFVEVKYLSNLKKICLQNNKLFVSNLILQFINKNKIESYPYKYILSSIVEVDNSNNLSWKKGIKILIQRNMCG